MALPMLSFAALIITSVAQIPLATLNCTPVNYARFRDRISEDGVKVLPVQVGFPGRFLATAYIFGCNGVITEWAAYTVHNGSHPVEFHVWRADETLPDVYHLVGMNVFQNAQPDANHLISFQVPPEEQITVSNGHIAGMRTVQVPGVSEGFQIQFDNGGSFLKYFPGDQSIPTPNTLDLRDSPSRVFTPGGSGLSRSPVIHANVVEIGSTTVVSTDIPSTTTPETVTPDLLPQAVIIAIVVSASVLFLAVFVMIFTLVMCCIFYNRSRKPQVTNQQMPASENANFNDELLQSYPLARNPAYSVHDGTHLMNNPAYKSNSQQLHVNDPAYSLSNNTEPYYSVIPECN